MARNVSNKKIEPVGIYSQKRHPLLNILRSDKENSK
jgi:hypothetical protein